MTCHHRRVRLAAFTLVSLVPRVVSMRSRLPGYVHITYGETISTDADISQMLRLCHYFSAFSVSAARPMLRLTRDFVCDSRVSSHKRISK
jgi:hypothetical protein